MIADWPILNALVNARPVPVGLGAHEAASDGNSIHAGVVMVADGTPSGLARLRRVLTNDPAMGVLRHADAGYPEAPRPRRHRLPIPTDR